MIAAPRLGAVRHPSSFRDPAGQIFDVDRRILRSVDSSAAAQMRQLCKSELFRELLQRKWIPATSILEADEHGALYDSLGRPELVLEHERIRFISYPYEWPFYLLRKAALFHLEVHLLALDHGFTLKDASAFNVQFTGVLPRFIDVLSFAPYVDDGVWIGHRQFHNQFVHPLLLTHLKGVGHHAWYRGSPEGIGSSDLVKLLTMWQKLTPGVFLNVVLAEWLQRRSELSEAASARRANAARLPKKALMAMLQGLRRWIESFELPTEPSPWAEYVTECNYLRTGTEFKRDQIREFIRAMKPHSVLDLGCNTGDFSVIALEEGATEAIGLDGDLNALNRACVRAESVAGDFLPLYADLADPAASQGWANRERSALTERLGCDGVLALAVLHHLVIGRNVPLAEVVRWICSLAPVGILEWIPKVDPQVQRMLRVREDIFGGYGIEAFEKALRENAEIVRVSEIPGTKRRLYWYSSARGT